MGASLIGTGLDDIRLSKHYQPPNVKHPAFLVAPHGQTQAAGSSTHVPPALSLSLLSQHTKPTMIRGHLANTWSSLL